MTLKNGKAVSHWAKTAQAGKEMLFAKAYTQHSSVKVLLPAHKKQYKSQMKRQLKIKIMILLPFTSLNTFQVHSQTESST